MNKLTKIKEIGLSKFNNAEYTNFMSRTSTEVSSVAREVLGITDADAMALQVNIAKMKDLVAHSHISDETAKLAELDKERDNLLVYLLAEINNKRRSPVTSERDAAVSLYNTTKPYIGCQNSPNQQATQEINGLILDLSKIVNTVHVIALNLAAPIEELQKANSSYERLTDARTNTKVATHLDNSTLVRQEMDKQYDYMITMAFATSVASPTAESSTFVKEMNGLIDEINTLYNQRIASEKSKVKEKGHVE